MQCMFMRRKLKHDPVTVTVDFIPSSHKDNSKLLNPTNAYHPYTNSSSRAILSVNVGSSSTGYFYFDTSSIPNNATIGSVTFRVKAGYSGSEDFSTKVVYLGVASSSGYMATTKGTTTDLTYDGGGGYDSSVRTISGTSWTVEEIHKACLELYGYIPSGDNLDGSLNLFGATLTVTYTY